MWSSAIVPVAVSAVAVSVRIGTSIAVLAILARVISFEMFGYVAFGMLIGQIASVLVDSGINNEVLRFVGEESEKKLRDRLASSVAVRLVVAPMIASVVLVSLLVTHGPSAAQLTMFSALAVIVGSLGESYFVAFRATGRHWDEMQQALVLAAVLFAAAAMTYVWPIAAGFLLFFSRIVSLGSLSKVSGTEVIYAIRQRTSIAAVVAHYRRIRHYSLDSLASNISWQLDGLLIATLLGKDAYAAYQPASRVVSGTASVGGIIGAIAMPRAARLKPASMSFKYLIAVFLVGGLVTFGVLLPTLGWGVKALFGRSFAVSGEVALVLGCITLLRFAAAGAGAFLTLQGLQAQRARVNVIVTLAVTGLAITWCDGLLAILLVMLFGQIVVLTGYYFTAFVHLKRQ